MFVLYQVLILLLSISYFLLEGKREAMYYHFKNQITGTDLKEHTLFTLQRSLFLISLLIVFLSQLTPIINSLLFIFSLSLIFPYFHDGMYYLTRNKLNTFIYKKRWKDNSTTSTAKFEIKYQLRLFMFLIGLNIYLFLTLISCVNF